MSKVMKNFSDDTGYRGRPERAIVFQVTAWDVNCPQHITPRWTEEELSSVVGELKDRVNELAAENARLRRELQESTTASVV